ncbi:MULTISPECIES: TauD/TfdA dioxygenase family protein [unclassified Sphingobium]|uniref:TauD/TfdA dioxygenase family protein n=1 Tax=unclassified Sphingobium TaxID=2611147 RepID=UPI000D1514AE|nr:MULTISPECIES: TauD/TfdA family dioxygenase [unclassified Sphingobium]MBG6120058.1 taurine dioxygenase [Sphingobium sp. JAI105]PSO12888.1 taurine dioxygenase [Sphingobium sp. AEW4]TWD05741.1 taurine dioxygenase [Sphingobium sp. AEW010]TWD23294.1 taurine dioxygenase [Sphingobium sp. AEW013]TWD25154.1 taurine dioxygenase [Sphingobium sp. AEW001]
MSATAVAEPRPAVKSGFTVRRLGGSLGAAIESIDLAAPISDTTMAGLRAAFIDHLVLVFPSQGHLSPAQHLAFAERWGPLLDMPGGWIGDSKALIEIASRGGKGRGGGQSEDEHETLSVARTDIWHSDLSFYAEPPMGSLLLAREIPDAGGDTIFANQYLAYETLSPAMRKMLEPLRAVHSGEGLWRINGMDPRLATRSAHPIVRTHPETGRKALYVNKVWTKQIEGMTLAESAPLLDFLYAHACEPNFTFRHRWTAGDLLMWDNRSVQHYAVRDYGAATRVMNRVTVSGDVPA